MTTTEYKRACSWADLIEANTVSDDLRPILARYLRQLGDDVDALRSRVSDLMDNKD